MQAVMLVMLVMLVPEARSNSSEEFEGKWMGCALPSVEN